LIVYVTKFVLAKYGHAYHYLVCVIVAH